MANGKGAILGRHAGSWYAATKHLDGDIDEAR